MELDGALCVITGGASGIGASTARAFARRGARVVVCDVNAAGAHTIASEVDGIGFGVDVGNEVQVQGLIDQVERTVGPIDLYFNNAGIASGSDPISTPIDDWNDQWRVNVMAHVYSIRGLLPRMLERGRGYFVHTASMAGILTTHGNIAYAATKHAVVAIAEWMSITYHNKGIRTTLLAPLGVNTPMLGNRNSAFAQNAAGPIKEPEEVADMVIAAVESESFLVLTDEIAQIWMDRKNSDLERWLNGMRRMQGKIEDAKAKGLE